jgi:hypothetical protein
VTGQINKYAGWASRKKSIAVDGIFIDEAPYNWNETTAKYLSDVKKAVKDSSGLGRRLISKFFCQTAYNQCQTSTDKPSL